MVLWLPCARVKIILSKRTSKECESEPSCVFEEELLDDSCTRFGSVRHVRGKEEYNLDLVLHPAYFFFKKAKMAIIQKLLNQIKNRS